MSKVKIEIDMSNEVMDYGVDYVIDAIKDYITSGELKKIEKFQDINGNTVASVEVDELNCCDYGHTTTSEVRRLPTGGDSAVLLCKKHYNVEKSVMGVEEDWESLEIVNG